VIFEKKHGFSNIEQADITTGVCQTAVDVIKLEGLGGRREEREGGREDEEEEEEEEDGGREDGRKERRGEGGVESGGRERRRTSTRPPLATTGMVKVCLTLLMMSQFAGPHLSPFWSRVLPWTRKKN
jgi:hypothetical protein